MPNSALRSLRLIILLLACSLAVACKDAKSADGKKRGGGGLPVRTARVDLSDVTYNVKALGTLEAEELVHITAEVGGAAKEVAFQAGDHVTADKVLVRIDPDRYKLEAQRADAARARAVADLKRSQSDLERREALAKKELLAIEELTRARLEVERLAADAAAAEAAYKIALQNVDRANVHAPRAGQINTRTVETGQFVQVGNTLATLVDPRRLRLRFKVTESESAKAQEGQNVTFRVGSLGDRDFTARVYHVSKVADPATRQVEVLAWVDNPGVLRPGFFAEVSLATGVNKSAIVIAESAVQASERGFVVFVVKDGKAKERPIQIGLRTGTGNVEIVGGLRQGETVVTEGSDRLSDGIAVDPAGALGEPKPRGAVAP